MRNIVRGERFDALVKQTVDRELAPGDGAGQHDLAQRVESRYIGARVGLRVAETLRLRERLRVLAAVALHGVEHEVRRAVQDPADGDDAVALSGESEVVQEGDRTAAGGGEEESHAVLPRQRVELKPARRDERLVGGDDVLAGLERGRYVFIGRVHAAHHLNDGVHLGIGEDLVQIADLIGLVLLPGTDEYGTGLKPWRCLQHFVYADTDGAESENCSFHITPHKLFFCPRNKNTCIFHKNNVS